MSWNDKLDGWYVVIGHSSCIFLLFTDDFFLFAECFVAIVTDCVPVGRIRAGEEVYRIQSVSFYSLSSSKYDDLEDPDRYPPYNSSTITNGSTTPPSDDWEQPSPIQHPCAQLEKLFAVGNFYFTPDFDLTKTVQAR